MVEVENYSYPIDAIIYEGSSFQISCVTGNNMPEMVARNRSNYGVLMINARGRSLNEIENMIKSRCYSPLF